MSDKYISKIITPYGERLIKAKAISQEAIDEIPIATTSEKGFMSAEDKLKLDSFITPEMFGAKGDDSTDDSVALQEAINYALNTKKLLVLISKYKCSRILLVTTNDHFKMYGLSTSESQITFTDGAYLRLQGTRLFEIKIRHLSLTASNSSPYALYADRLDQCYFEDVYFSGGTDCNLYCVGYFVWFVGCYFMNSPKGIKLRGDLNIFKDCNIWNHSDSAFYLIGSANETVFENCVFEGYAKLIDADLSSNYSNTISSVNLRCCHCLGAMTTETGIARSFVCDIVQTTPSYFALNLILNSTRVFTPNEDSGYVIQLSTNNQSYISIYNSYIRPNNNASSIIKTDSNTKANLKVCCMNRLDTLGKDICNDFSKVTMIGSIQTANYFTSFIDGLLLGDDRPQSSFSNEGFINYDSSKKMIRLFVNNSNLYRYLQTIHAGPTSSRPSVASQGQTYFDYTITKQLVFKGDGWLQLMPLQASSSSNRPHNPVQGQIYYDTTLSKCICWSGSDWTNLDGTSL